MANSRYFVPVETDCIDETLNPCDYLSVGGTLQIGSREHINLELFGSSNPHYAKTEWNYNKQ